MRSRHAGINTVASLIAASALVVLASPLSATWSVIAVDMRTGRVVIASATCVSQARLEGFPAKGLMDVQAIVVPGIGVAAAQAGVDRIRENQWLIFRELKNGTSPERILVLLMEDPDIQRRQFGVVDLQGRFAGFSGSGNRAASLSVQDTVVHDAVAAFKSETGSVTDRVMAAMEAADAAGGDVRCTCETEPVPPVQCDSRNAHVAYILAADRDDPSGESFNDGEYALYINVTDQNIGPEENANPVMTLRMRYDRWMVERSRN